MMQHAPLMFLLLLGALIKNSLLASAAGILLVLSFLQMNPVLAILQRRGIELGLLVLTISLLSPFATGQVGLSDLRNTLLTAPGIVAILGGAVAAILNGRGVHLLSVCPEIATSVILGSLASIVFFGGIPVGPVMAAGVTAVLLRLLSLLY